MQRAPPPALLYLALTGLLPFSSAGSSPLSLQNASLPLALYDVTNLTTLHAPIQHVESSEETSRTSHKQPLNTFDTSIEDSTNDVKNKTKDVRNDGKEDLPSDAEDKIRKKRSSEEWDKTPKPPDRVRTGDTILQIGGAVRDAIGDAAAAPGPRASSRLDSFVIRPAAPPRVTPSPAPGEHYDHTTPKPDPRELLVDQHSTVRIPCDLNVTEVIWYKDNEPMSLPVEGTTVVISRAERAHAGYWRCTTAKGVSGEPRKLLIYEPVWSVYLSVDGRRLDANTWVPLRDRASMRVACNADGGVPPPSLVWRIRGGIGSVRLPPTATNHSIPGMSYSEMSLTGARQIHGATLTCAATQRRPRSRDHPPASAKIDIHVTYPPSFVISRWPGFGVSLVAGRGAALRCDVDANPPARAAWQRDHPHNAAPIPLEALGAETSEGVDGAAILRWATLQPSHAGWYRCRAEWNQTHYSSIGYYLNVIELDGEDLSQTETETESPLDTEEPVHQKIDVPLGGNVQLNCPKGSVGCWWRRVVGHNASRWAPAAPGTRAHGALGIVGAVYEEGGEYRCVGARSADLRDLRDLKRVTLSVTGGATARVVSADPFANGWRLDCSVCGRNLRVVWVQPNAGDSQNVIPAVLKPDLATHCWRTTLHVQDGNERWCVASTPNGGAVAVFESRESSAPDIPPALRALHDGGTSTVVSNLLLLLCIAVR